MAVDLKKHSLFKELRVRKNRNLAISRPDNKTLVPLIFVSKNVKSLYSNVPLTSKSSSVQLRAESIKIIKHLM